MGDGLIRGKVNRQILQAVFGESLMASIKDFNHKRATSQLLLGDDDDDDSNVDEDEKKGQDDDADNFVGTDDTPGKLQVRSDTIHDVGGGGGRKHSERCPSSRYGRRFVVWACPCERPRQETMHDFGKLAQRTASCSECSSVLPLTQECYFISHLRLVKNDKQHSEGQIIGLVACLL